MKTMTTIKWYDDDDDYTTLGNWKHVHETIRTVKIKDILLDVQQTIIEYNCFKNKSSIID